MEKAQQQRREEEERQRQRQQMSPLERELDDLATADRRRPDYLTWLHELQQGRWSEEGVQRQVAAKIRDRMTQKGIWRPRTQKKRPDRDKPYQRTLAVLRFLGEDSS